MTANGVSVPCGVFVFLNRNLTFFDGNCYAVSVPCGVFVFLNKIRKSMIEKWEGEVSVPCGVFVFLNRGKSSSVRNQPEFPSPAGSSYFSILLIPAPSCRGSSPFPSPAGSSYFSIHEAGYEPFRVLYAVSVPCGVFVFLNEFIGCSMIAGTAVSVPCGVFVFLNGREPTSVSKKPINCFRPLRGLRISQFL